MTDRWAATRAAYDTVATSYADLIRLDRTETALDRAVLEDFVARVRGQGPVLDAGCGPGRLTRHLADRGVAAFGIDLSPEMVRTARQRHPDLHFTVGSIDSLDVAGGSLAGVLAWYSVVHTPPGELGTVLGELIRVIAPGGWLLLAFQSGDGALHLTRAYGHDIDLTAHLHAADEVARLIEGRGGTVHLRVTRGPDGAETLPQAFVLAHLADADTALRTAPMPGTGAGPW